MEFEAVLKIEPMALGIQSIYSELQEYGILKYASQAFLYSQLLRKQTKGPPV